MRGLVGSYTKDQGQGIYTFELSNQAIHDVRAVAQTPDATYLAVHGDYVYAVKRDKEYAGIRTFKIKNDAAFELEQVGDLDNKSDSGCYVAVVSDGKYVIDAAYGSGEIRLYKIENNIVTGVLDTYQIEGSGPHERQDSAHAHFIDETPDGYVVAVDLGADKVVTLKIEDEKLVLVHELEVKAGSGPRHLRFSPCERYAYIFTELSNEIFVAEYADGVFKVIETYSTLPEDFDGHSQGAAVRLHDGYLYASNRGHNSVAVFKLVDGGARLELLQIEGTRGDWPRDFNITDDGKSLVVAHERSHELALFEIEEDGRLKFLNNNNQAPEGVFITFL